MRGWLLRGLVAAVCFVGCAPVVIVEGEPVCLSPGAARPSLAPLAAPACPATCLEMGPACGSVDLGCGEVVECGCGNTMMSCHAGACECTPAPGDVPCAACPGRVPRFCGERNPKTQQGCDPTTSEVDGSLVWCCNE